MSFYTGTSEYEIRSEGSLVWGNQSGLGITINTTYSDNANQVIEKPADVSFTALADGNMVAVWSLEEQAIDSSADSDLFYRVFNPSTGDFITDEVQLLIHRLTMKLMVEFQSGAR